MVNSKGKPSCTPAFLGPAGVRVSLWSLTRHTWCIIMLQSSPPLRILTVQPKAFTETISRGDLLWGWNELVVGIEFGKLLNSPAALPTYTRFCFSFLWKLSTFTQMVLGTPVYLRREKKSPIHFSRQLKCSLRRLSRNWGVFRFISAF